MDDDFAEEEFVMGGGVYEGYPIGTFIAVIENGKNTDLLFCIGGTVEFKGNATNGTMIANLEFQSLVTEDIVEKINKYFEEKEIEATGHAYEEIVTAPICEEAGYTTEFVEESV